jgi:hypothetical protein
MAAQNVLCVLRNVSDKAGKENIFLKISQASILVLANRYHRNNMSHKNRVFPLSKDKKCCIKRFRISQYMTQ